MSNCAVEERVLTCVYCGHEYPQGTPSSGAGVLTEHIKICEKHPMKELVEQNRILRSALVGLVGVDGKEELERMEFTIRTMPFPDADKATTINAVHALMATLKSGST
jgi:hypothetical protein